LIEACTGGAWPNIIRKGTCSNQIMYKVTDFIITFKVMFLSLVVRLRPSMVRPLKTICCDVN